MKWADHWNYAGFDLEGFISKRAVLHEQCEAAGRNADDILTSIHQPVDAAALDQLKDDVAAFKAAGLGMMVFYLPPPHDASILEPLAAIAEAV